MEIASSRRKFIMAAGAAAVLCEQPEFHMSSTSKIVCTVVSGSEKLVTV